MLNEGRVTSLPLLKWDDDGSLGDLGGEVLELIGWRLAVLSCYGLNQSG